MEILIVICHRRVLVNVYSVFPLVEIVYNLVDLVRGLAVQHASVFVTVILRFALLSIILFVLGS
jgi:hypothetical protein